MAKRRFYTNKKPQPGQGGIYDDQTPKPTGPNNKNVYDSDQDLLDIVNEESRNRGLGNIDGEDGGDSGSEETEDDKALSPEKLKEAEERGDQTDDTKDKSGGKDGEEAASDQAGKGYSEEPETERGKVQRQLRAKKKAFWLGGGGLTVAIAGILASALISFAPLKILHIVNNLQERFFATSESAVQRRSEALMSRYLKKHIFPNLAKANCTSTKVINRNCVDAIPGNSQADKLFRAWRDGRIENRLADEFGLEISRNPSNGLYSLSVNGNSPLNITDFVGTNENLFTEVGSRRADLRLALSQSFEGGSKWKKTMWRFKFGRFVERKYGLRRCIFMCKSRDNLDDWRENKGNAAKLFILRRIVEPNTELIGLALSCIVSGSCIDPNSSPEPSTDGTGRKDRFEQQIRSYLDQRGVQYADDTVAKLVELLPKMTDIMDKGLFTYLVSTVMTKVFNEQVAKMTERFIPVVGWIDTGARIVNTIANAGEKIRRYGFNLKTTAMVSLYMAYLTFGDEIKTGNVDSELAGSMIQQLSEEAGDSEHYGEPAENSPLYGVLIDQNAVAASPIPNILSGTAFAQPSNEGLPDKYTCDDGLQIRPGKIICDEESVATSNLFTKFSDLFDTAPLNYVKDVAEFWLASGGAILDQLSGLFSFIGPVFDSIVSVIPGYSYLRSNFESLTAPLMEAFARYIFPATISVGMGGARTFSQMAGGASAAGSAYAHYGLGGQLLTPAQTASIINEQQNQARDMFNERSVFARMFDTDDSRSFVSRLALSLPTKSAFTQGGVANLLSNPFGKLANSLSSVFLTPRTQAAIPVDPFGIPSYGFPLETTNFDYESDIYTDGYCKQVNAEWEAGTGQFEGTLVIDAETGMDVHTKSNPCLLEAAAVGSAGGYTDASLLTADEVNGP